MVKVLFFAQLRELLGTENLSLDIGRPMTVAELTNHLANQGEKWKKSLLTSRTLVAVNHEMAMPETLVNLEDEVAYFPPVTGG